MNNAIRSMIAAVLFIISSSCVLGDIRIPEGWRVIAKSEANQEWRKKDPFNYLYVKGDFNGDGYLDVARFLINEKNNELALFAFISQGDKTYKTILLNKDSIDSIKAMGITIVYPGKYLTVYGLGVVEGSPDEIVLDTEAINYFKIESAYGFYYWDKMMEKFEFVWIND